MEVNLEHKGVKQLEVYISNLEKENEELKKQLENYKKLGFKHLQDKNNNLKIHYEIKPSFTTRKIKELQQENKQLKEINEEHKKLNGELREENKKYKEIIDKAIEYINKYESIKAYYEYIDEDGYDEYDYDEDFKKELLDILKEVSE